MRFPRMRSLWASLSWVGRTGSLLRPAGLNNRAAALLSRIKRKVMWKVAPTWRVPPGSRLEYRGRITSTFIIEVEDG